MRKSGMGCFTVKIAKTANRESGSVMLAVFFFAIAISMVIFAASTMVVLGNKNVHRTSILKQARYLAEMGIEEALSDPFVLRDALRDGVSTVSSSSPLTLENGKKGTYQVTVSKEAGNTIEIASRGEVRNQSEDLLAAKTIRCEFQLRPGSFYDALLKNAISTSQNLDSGKVYIYIDEDEQGNPVASSADIYSDADVTSVRGAVPGSIIAQGNVIVNNDARVERDVIARGYIVLNNKVEVKGKVISAESYIEVNNNAVVSGDIVAYGTDDKGYSVYLANSSVQDIYTELGESQVYKSKSASYSSIGTISGSGYPDVYDVPRQSLPVIDDSIKAAWIARAQSDGITYNGLYVSDSFTIDGNVYINGDFELGNTATLNVREGSVIYVTGQIRIQNNASISVIDSNGDGVREPTSLVTEDYFDVRNNSIPEVVSLVALGSSTSYFWNNSVTTGAILVPNGNLEISNNAVIYGGVFAKSIPKIGNNAEIYFNPLNNLSLPPPFTSGQIFNLLSWTE